MKAQKHDSSSRGRLGVFTLGSPPGHLFYVDRHLLIKKVIMTTTVDAIIVGAGAAGLTAGYTLQAAGWSVKVLEANEQVIGGRLRKDTTWDVPIDIGGEWIHVSDPSRVLEEIVDREVSVDTILHDVGELSIWDGSEFYKEDISVRDHKWVDSTWWDFFNDNVASFIAEDIVLGCNVEEIDYTENETKVTCDNEETYKARYVVVTASMKVLQEEHILFMPPLPDDHQEALGKFKMEPAVKFFVEFEEGFYPQAFDVESDYSDYSLNENSINYGERTFWDATFGQTTSAHIMGLFAYARAADQYLDQDEETLVDDLLSELDIMFDGEASEKYVGHVFQNWSDEPYVQTGYTRWVNDDYQSIGTFQKPLDSKVIFAGESLPVDRESWGYAHGAALSGKQAAKTLLGLDTDPSGGETPSGICGVILYTISLLAGLLGWS